MIAVLIVFLAANGGKVIWWKTYQNMTATRQRRDSVTGRDTIARKIDTQNNKAGTGHRQDRDEISTTVITAWKTVTGHWQYRDKISTTLTTAFNRSACWVPSKLATKWKTSYLWGCWLRILSGDSFHVGLLGALVCLTLFGIDTVEKSWGVNWIYRDLPINIQFFGSSSICVVCNIDETGTR